jgi:hypothetical protein
VRLLADIHSPAPGKPWRPGHNTDSDPIGVAALLGHDGVAAQIDDAKGIVAAGGSPLTVALLEQRPGNVTTLVLMVPALAPQRRMLH